MEVLDVSSGDEAHDESPFRVAPSQRVEEDDEEESPEESPLPRHKFRSKAIHDRPSRTLPEASEAEKTLEAPKVATPSLSTRGRESGWMRPRRKFLPSSLFLLQLPVSPSTTF